MEISKTAMRKKFEITTCASVNATGALLITKNRTDSASDGIDRGTGCNLYFEFCRVI